MFDIPWSHHLGIYRHNELPLLVHAIVAMLVVLAIEQRLFPTLSKCVLALSPFIMLEGAFFFLIAQFRYAGPADCFMGSLCLSLGLVYATRCMQLNMNILRWMGCVFSFIYLVTAVAIVVTNLSYLLLVTHGLKIPMAISMLVPVAAAVLWAYILRRNEFLKPHSHLAAEHPPFRESDA